MNEKKKKNYGDGKRELRMNEWKEGEKENERRKERRGEGGKKGGRA